MKFSVAFIGLVFLAACQNTPSSTPNNSAVMSSSAEARRICSDTDFDSDDKTIEWSDSWNRDAPTETITLDQPTNGFTINIPYNSSWGNTDCQLRPYDEKEGKISFGHAGIFEGGGAIRYSGILLHEPRSAAEALKVISEEQKTVREIEGYQLPEPETMTVNGNTVIQYSTGGFCDQTYYEVVGKQFNYVVTSTCDIDDPVARMALESLWLY